MKVFQVYRTLVLHQNGRSRIATRDNEDAAKRDRDEANQRTTEILKARLGMLGPGGAGQDKGLALGDFRAAIGIQGFAHEMEEVEVQGSIEVPRARLIIPN